MKVLRDCRDALCAAYAEIRRGNDEMATVMTAVLRQLEGVDGAAAQELSAMALFGLARLDVARGRHAEAHNRRRQAVAALDRLEAPGDFPGVLDMIADELLEMGENRKALPYCNRAVDLSRGDGGALGARLFRAGRCHHRVGFPEAALAQLREAVPRLRQGPLYPLLAPALMDLGTVAYKSAPQEGAAALREAAALYEARGDATHSGIAWLNLGVALSHAGDLDAALAAYDRAHEIRAANPATTPTQRGNLHNNVAGVWRRKRDFARARAESAKALALLKTVGGESLAHALGSLGEIARDEGQAEEALAAFAQARALFERLPGVSLDNLAIKLENEAGALATLGRAREAAVLRARVATLRSEAARPSLPPAGAPPAHFAALR